MLELTLLFLGLENETLTSRKDYFLEGYFAAWKGGDGRHLGGAAAPPTPPARESFFFDFWLNKFLSLLARFWA